MMGTKQIVRIGALLLRMEIPTGHYAREKRMDTEKVTLSIKKKRVQLLAVSVKKSLSISSTVILKNKDLLFPEPTMRGERKICSQAG